MSLTPGLRLGAYEIVALLGAGGMGEVYRARDTRLKREVAIKVLPESHAHDTERLTRFQREAELLATLNHSNIAAIYGLEKTESHKAIILELVEGETLAELIARSGATGLPLDDALSIARQIADALEAAHERGVIHRDLKPANIKVQPDGHVKVLGFGLAKLLDTAPAASSLSMSQTLSVHATYAGVILGTAAYMSPEQARGKPVDRRTDIWSFGCVLFEMLTGKQPFASGGDTVSDAVAAILRGDVDWAALPTGTPAAIEHLLRRCLNKDPRERLHDIADARLDIEEARHAPDIVASAMTTQPARTGSRLAWSVAGALAIAAVALAIPAMRYVRQPAPERLVTRLEVTVPAGVDPISLALSPDGRRLAFVATGGSTAGLWVRLLDQTSAQLLPGTEGASYPFWAPDGRTVAFFAGGKLKRVDLAGGGPQTLADAPGARGGTWGRDGTIIFTTGTGGGLMQIASTGGNLVSLTTLASGQSNHRWPQFFPDGRHFLYYAVGGDAGGVYVGSIDGGDSIRVMAADSAAVYAPPNRLLLVRQDTLIAFDFDPIRATIRGEPVAVAQPVGANLAPARGAFAVSDTGVLAYQSASAGQRRQLVWHDRSGRILGRVGQPDDDNMPSIALALDGRRVATTRNFQGNQDVWQIDLNRGVPSRFTFRTGGDSAPLWSPDGERIVFRSTRNGVNDLFEKPASGAGDEQPLLVTAENKMAYDWSRDGRTLLYGTENAKTGADIWALPLSGDRKAFPVVQSTFAEDSAQFFPDGQWVAWESNESGQFEIYAQAFPTARGKWQLSAGGGVHPRWRADGREIFYVAPDGRLMATPVTIGSNGQSLETGTPLPLFTPRMASGGTILSPGALARPVYAVSADGRFLINTVMDDETVAPITVVLNWDEGLR